MPELERCASCSGLGGNAHHRKLRSQGGGEQPSNKLPLCGSGTTGCHGHWHHHRDQASRLGYIVEATADPAAIPYYSLPWGSWVLPRDDETVKLIEPPPGNDARNYVATKEDTE